MWCTCPARPPSPRPPAQCASRTSATWSSPTVTSWFARWPSVATRRPPRSARSSAATWSLSGPRTPSTRPPCSCATTPSVACSCATTVAWWASCRSATSPRRSTRTRCSAASARRRRTTKALASRLAVASLVVMDMPAKLAEIVEEFATAPRDVVLEMLLEYVDAVSPLPAHLSGHAGMEQVPECQTPFFLRAEVAADRTVALYFDCPPEAPTTRAFAGILAEGLAGATATEVLAVPDDLYATMGLATAISPLRVRGGSAILARLKRQVGNQLAATHPNGALSNPAERSPRSPGPSAHPRRPGPRPHAAPPAGTVS